MTKKQLLVNSCHRGIFALLVLLAVVCGAVGTASAQQLAANCGGNPSSTQETGAGAPPPANIPCPLDCSKAENKNKPACDCTNGNCIVTDYINPAIKALTALAGVVAVISIILGGIQYSSAGGDPGKVSAAKDRIAKTVGAFIFFLFLYGFLNWLVPGGI